MSIRYNKTSGFYGFSFACLLCIRGFSMGQRKLLGNAPLFLAKDVAGTSMHVRKRFTISTKDGIGSQNCFISESEIQLVLGTISR
jgi:hypothetical protein